MHCKVEEEANMDQGKERGLRFRMRQTGLGD